MNEKNIRKKKLIWFLTGAAVLGSTAALFMMWCNIYLPCPFRAVTGYLCPGCGATRMVLSILKLDFVTAFNSNKMLFISLPFVIYILAAMAVNYVRYGNLKCGHKTEKSAVVLAVCFVIFGIGRNLI